MFIDGLIHLVDIKPIERNFSNRTSKSQMKAEEVTEYDIPCRIINDEKIMFTPDIELKTGDVLYNKDRDIEFQVESEYRANSFVLHHRTYKVKRKMV